jgi:hypothetical protein
MVRDERVLLVGEALLGQRRRRLRGKQVEGRGERRRVEVSASETWVCT